MWAVAVLISVSVIGTGGFLPAARCVLQKTTTMSNSCNGRISKSEKERGIIRKMK